MRIRFDFLEIVLALLTIVLILAIIMTIMALAYPDVTASIVNDIRQGVSDGKSPVLVAFSKIGQRLSESINYRIRPFVRKTRRWIAGLELPKMPTQKAVLEVAISDCVSCHKDFFDQRANGSIYVDHRLHEAQEIPCVGCHQDVKHPKPKKIKQKVCIDCHEDRRASVACDTCHAPGSIFDKSVVSEEKTKKFLEGRSAYLETITRPGFAVPDPDWLKAESPESVGEEHQTESPCRNCHVVPDFCNSCHMVFHDKVSDWRETHGPRILRRQYIPNGCWPCHNPNWCSDTCHAGTNRNQRRDGFKTPPTVPIEDYLR